MLLPNGRADEEAAAAASLSPSGGVGREAALVRTTKMGTCESLEKASGCVYEWRGGGTCELLEKARLYALTWKELSTYTLQ